MARLTALHLRNAAGLARAAGLFVLLALPAGCGSRLSFDASVELRQGDTAKTFDTETFSGQSGQDVRFRFVPHGAGYLYVLMKGSSGACSLIYPNRDNKTSESLKGPTPVLVPAGSGEWLRFDQTPGPEDLYVVYSRERIPELETMLAGPAPTSDQVQSALQEVGAKASGQTVRKSTIKDRTVYSTVTRSPGGIMVADIELKHF